MLKNEIIMVRITSHQNMYLYCIYQLDSDTLVSPKLQLYQLSSYSSLMFDAICYLICQGCMLTAEGGGDPTWPPYLVSLTIIKAIQLKQYI